jgi:hypothetical protein
MHQTSALTGRALKLLKKGRDLFPGGECEVFYAGSMVGQILRGARSGEIFGNDAAFVVEVVLLSGLLHTGLCAMR